MSIEERLKDILREKDGYIHRAEAEQLAIAQIIAAFKDGGWIPMSKLNQPRNMMTGQEFYDRFRSELPPVVVGDIPSGAEMFLMCQEAAKKASGVDQ